MAALSHKASYEANFILRYRTIMLFLQARGKTPGELEDAAERGERGRGRFLQRKKKSGKEVWKRSQDAREMKKQRRLVKSQRNANATPKSIQPVDFATEPGLICHWPL